MSHNNITNKMTCAPSDDTDQTGHPSSLFSLHLTTFWVVKDPNILQANSEDSDQTG